MSYPRKKLNGSVQESERRCRLQAKAEQPCKHPLAVSTGNETDGKLTNSHSSAGSQDLGEHGKSQHPPSGRLRQAGLSVSHMQVARWRNKGWRAVAQNDHPLEAARKALDDAIPLLTSNPN